MRRTIKGLLALLAVAVLVGAAGFLLPQQVQLERRITIDAPPATVFAVVDGFRNFDRWSPWADQDPHMTVALEGALYGVGAGYRWSGNSAVGSGSQEIVEAKPFHSVTTRLHFGDMAAPSFSHFHIEPHGGGSLVSWSFSTDLGFNPYGRYFGPLIRHGVAPDYERGLKRLKDFVESLPKTDFSGLHADLVGMPGVPLLSVAGSSRTDPQAIAAALAPAYARIDEYLKSAGIPPAGAPVAITRSWDPAADHYAFEAGIPVPAGTPAPPADSGIVPGSTPGGQLLKVEYHGPLDGIGPVFDQIDAYCRAYGLQANGDTWEQYPTDPSRTAPADQVTLIYMPVK